MRVLPRFLPRLAGSDPLEIGHLVEVRLQLRQDISFVVPRVQLAELLAQDRVERRRIDRQPRIVWKIANTCC